MGYAIVKRKFEEDYWIQGDEGRVNDPPFDSLAEAVQAAQNMADEGHEIVTDRYFIDDDENGPDWDYPVVFTQR